MDDELCAIFDVCDVGRSVPGLEIRVIPQQISNAFATKSTPKRQISRAVGWARDRLRELASLLAVWCVARDMVFDIEPLFQKVMLKVHLLQNLHRTGSPSNTHYPRGKNRCHNVLQGLAKETRNVVMASRDVNSTLSTLGQCAGFC